MCVTCRVVSATARLNPLDLISDCLLVSMVLADQSLSEFQNVSSMPGQQGMSAQSPERAKP